jgi:putative transposase
MVDREYKAPSVRRQRELLRLPRSGLYYERVPADAVVLAVMRRIDELHLAHPFYESRKMSQQLGLEGPTANRKRVQRLMRRMGLEALVPKPRTSEPHPEHAVYPYLL